MTSEFDGENKLAHNSSPSPTKPISAFDDGSISEMAYAAQHSGRQMIPTQPSPQTLAMSSRNVMSHEGTMLNTSIPGAAFNTTPIYDAQGSLVGLQAPMENGIPNVTNSDRQDAVGYMTLPQMYQYNLASQPTNTMMTNDYLPYGTYSIGQNAYNTGYLPHNQQLQHLPQRHQPQMYEASYHHTDPQQKPFLVQGERLNEATVIRGIPKLDPSFDKCPAMCSLFAILFCPITLCCSLPALVYSICAYTDYRATDSRRYQRKSDVARHLVITACLLGLLLCVSWAVLAFFYYEIILATVADVVRVMQHRMQT